MIQVYPNPVFKVGSGHFQPRFQREATKKSFFGVRTTKRGVGEVKAGQLRKQDFFEARKKNSEKNKTTKP